MGLLAKQVRKNSNFIEEHCAGAKNYHEITEQIKETEIKHFDPKIPKFFQHLYAFDYVRLIEFSRSNSKYETLATLNFVTTCIKS